MLSISDPAPKDPFAKSKDLEAWRASAESLMKDQRWDKCIEACQKVLELEPRNHFAQETVATALLQMGQVDEAVIAVARLLEISPRDPLHRLRLATLLQMQGRNGEALHQFERILVMYPDAPFAEDARNAVENLDRVQTQQILLMAAEQDDFRWMLERDPANALASNHFKLSENGYESLRQMIPGADEDSTDPPVVLH